MQGRLAPGAMVAVYIAAVQWLVMGLFAGRSELLLSLVPLSLVTVVLSEGAMLLRPYVDGEGVPHVHVQSLTLWAFLLCLLGFASVAYFAGSRSAGEIDSSAWKWVEWVVTLVVSGFTLTTWSYVQASYRDGEVS